MTRKDKSTGLRLLIDNTTLQRLAFAADGRLETMHESEQENVLHLLECLVLCEDLCVNGFESGRSQQFSEELMEWLGSNVAPDLIRVSAWSDETTQMEVAASAAREMFERGFLFARRKQRATVDPIDVTLALPPKVDKLSHPWTKRMLKRQEWDFVRERADEAVAQHRTDALFDYGIAQHDDILVAMRRTHEKGRAPTRGEWAQLNVIFRSFFNLHFAEQNARTYAPPPLRASILDAIYSAAAADLRRVLADVADDLHTHSGSVAFAAALLADTQEPLPLIGLTCLLDADAADPGAPFAERLLRARELAGPLRARIARLESLTRGDTFARELKHERDELDGLLRARLQITEGRGLQLRRDITASFDPIAPELTLPIGPIAAGVGEEVGDRMARTRILARSRRLSVLSNGLGHTLRHKTVEQAVRHAIKRT